MNDDTTPFGAEIDPNRLPHPYVAVFHVIFRSLALLTYLFCGWFSDSFISSFVAVVLFLSIDFWTVKNITGRLLVGLRWWNYVDDDGNSHWVYESKKGITQNAVNKTESQIFWAVLIAFPAIWGLLCFVALFSFRFKWLLLVVIATSLSSANLHGYLKCKFNKNEPLQNSLKNMTTNFFKEKAVSMMTSSTQPQNIV